MKRFLSLLTALLLAVLPACSLAGTNVLTHSGTTDAPEATEAPVAVDEPAVEAAGGTVLSYMLAGQALTTDVSVSLGDGVLSLMDESIRQPVQDLLNVLSIRVTEQVAEDQTQVGLAFMLNDTEAVNATFAGANDNLYVGSNLLKDKVLSFSAEEIKQFILENSDPESAEALAALFSIWSRYSKDPEGCFAALWEKLDSEKFLTALNNILEGAEIADLSGDVPEKLPDASLLLTIPLKKADLTDLCAGLADLIWSVPVMEKLAPLSTINDQPMTHENLTTELSKLPDALADDAVLNIYMNDLGETYAVFDATVNSDEGTVPCRADVLILDTMTDTDETLAITWTVVAGENKLAMDGALNMISTADAVNVDYTVNSAFTEDGKTFSPIHETIAATMKTDGNKIVSSADILYAVQPDADSEVTNVAIRVDSAAEDKGDHAEEDMTAVITMDGVGEIATIKSHSATGAAEAFIVTDNAVSPMAMSESELEALLDEVSENAQSVLLSLITELPSSVLTLLIGN